MKHKALTEIVQQYNPHALLTEAFTIPSSWYTDERVYELEQQTVFGNCWQYAGRLEQVSEPGQYFTTHVAGEPILVVRDNDRVLRGFFNVCRHHAAAVMTKPEGTATQLRCPYHGWTYSLGGQLRGTPDFVGVCSFEKSANGLKVVETAVWEKWIFARIEKVETSLDEFLGPELISKLQALGLQNFHWFERRHYSFECNWKVFVDNYLDGGYHVPHLHKGLDSVLDYQNYLIENGERFCLQWSPLVKDGAEQQTGAMRTGERALYYWIYPNFMINWYQGAMDTNLVIPRGVNQTEVVFDFYFPDVSSAAFDHNKASIEIGERIQNEDVAICKSVQQGLRSRAYNAGRLSVRREAGEHLFHRLLYQDLNIGLA